MRVISPHLDDAVLHCGALLGALAEDGWAICVVTVFAGTSTVRRGIEPAFDDVESRCAEDDRACEALGVSALHLDLPEALFRFARGHPCYPDLRSLVGAAHPADPCTVEDVLRAIEDAGVDGPSLWPAGCSRHVDHQIVTAAGRAAGATAWYDDHPRFAGSSAGMVGVDRFAEIRGEVMTYDPSQTRSSVKETAVRAYDSQVPFLFGSTAAVGRYAAMPEQFVLTSPGVA